MSKYAPLRQYLEHQQGERLTLSFSEVEKIIGAPLPHSAKTHRAWWANDSTHVHANEWLTAGWRTEDVSLTAGRADFVHATGRTTR